MHISPKGNVSQCCDMMVEMVDFSVVAMRRDEQLLSQF